MLFRCGRRGALPGVVAIVLLLCMSLMGPGAAIAAQPDAATPITAEPVPPEEHLTTSDDGDVSAAASNMAIFNEPVYFIGTGDSVTAALMIQMAGIDTGGTFSFGFLAPSTDFALQSPVATPVTSGVSCDVTILDGTISGSFTNTDIGPGTCEIAFTIASISSVPVIVGPGITGTVFWGDGTSVPVSTIIAPILVPLQVTGTFDQDFYSATVGESFPIGMTIDVPAGTLSGSTATFLPLTGLLSYASVTGTAGGGATCSATNDPVAGVQISFSNPSQIPGTCTVSLSATMLSWPGDGAQIFVFMNIFPLGAAGFPAQATIVGYTPSSGTLSFSLDSTTAFPGDIVSGTVSQGPAPLQAASEYKMQVQFPAGVTGVAGSGVLTCAPALCTGQTVTIGPTSALVTYMSVLLLESATLTFDVQIDDDVPAGSLAFNANGETGTGLQAQRTGPATASLTVLEALATSDLDLTVPYHGTGSGTIAATGGTSGYTFSVQDAPSLGEVDLDAATGAFTYSANDLATGGDSFTVLVTDSTSPTPYTVLATVNVTISDPAPLTAAALTLSVNPGDTITGSLASQVSGGMPPYTFTVLDQPSQGLVTIDADGNYSYQANDDASGSDTFTYQVTDSEPQATGLAAAASVTGEVTISYAAVPATATATATEPDGTTPTATVTTDPGVPPVRPNQTATSTPVSGGTGTTDGSGTGVTALPSTGAGSDHTNSMLLLLLTGALLLLMGSIGLSRRR